MTARLRFNAFSMNSVSHITHGLWTHPDTKRLDYDDLQTWVELAQLLERGKFDALCLADVIGTHDSHKGSRDVAVLEGLQIPVNDPSLLIPAMAHATENLGFAFTHSVLQERPFNLARRISTLDHLTDGRVAWNIVTSYLETAGRNLGYGGLPSHDDRYDRAEEHLEVLYELLEGSWEDDAVLRDVERGVYADPAKIHDVDHRGRHYPDVVGPHLSEPSPQRTPVLFQAGSSERGREFAARHAEAVFLAAGNPLGARIQAQDVRVRAVRHGRDPRDLLFYQGLSVIVGGTEEEARRKEREIEESASDEGSAAHMRVVGAPEQVADELESWADAGIDGINVMCHSTPGSFAEFIDGVTPVLQERGLQQSEYAPGTLRQKLTDGAAGPRLVHRHPAAAYRRAEVAAKEALG